MDRERQRTEKEKELQKQLRRENSGSIRVGCVSGTEQARRAAQSEARQDQFLQRGEARLADGHQATRKKRLPEERGQAGG